MFTTVKEVCLILLVLAFMLGLWVLPVSTSAQTGHLTTLHAFLPSLTGADPQGSLIQGTDGNFYGTTYDGGPFNDGIVFKITPGGSETLLYTFQGGSDGANPAAGLLQGADGIFYGTTVNGGSNNAGTVFKITPAGTETVLYSFQGGSDGANPYAGLIQGTDGNFYGTTSSGGASGKGTVFKMTSTGSETIIYRFQGGSDGANPYANLIRATDGNFYGTTLSGGASGKGTVFKMTSTGSETVLHSFSGGTDGVKPYAGLIQASDGNFYGTTAYGGTNGYGIVFKITPAGSETVLYYFKDGYDGANPYAPLIQATDGNFYGTTQTGGIQQAGVVFKITPTGSETWLYMFQGSPDGGVPKAGLLQAADGNFYGTLSYGGTPNNYGAIFKMTLTGTEIVLYSFPGNFDGGNPLAGLVPGFDGNFYGTTRYGGAYNDGTVFKITPAGIQTLLYAFQGKPDGANPYAPLIQATDGNFYGTTFYGGAYGGPIGTGIGYGTVFKITPGGTETVLYSFKNGSTDGFFPQGSLLQGSDGNFYGTTIGGATQGTVFKITPAGAETVLHWFYGSPDGWYPVSNLIQASDGDFYGATTGGGTAGGIIFKITPDGSETIFYDFQGGADGANPNAIIQASDGNFYGTTLYGGAYSYGTAFKLTPGGVKTVLHSFGNGTDGAYPASLFQASGGNFYSTTYQGGAKNLGTVFKMTPAGTVTVLYSFTGGSDGSHPEAGVIQGSGGNFYGTTYDGAYSYGTVFRLSVAPSDFNADGSPDLLFQNGSTGQLSVWFMNGVTPTGGAFITPNQNTAWKAVGDADFNQDGNPDILFQNPSTGQLALWLMNGTTATGGQILSSTLPSGWSAVSLADFNGDGSPDLLLQNTSTGQLAIWYMSGSNVVGGAYVTPTPAKGWTAVGTGDFNKDGYTDILLQNITTGQLAAWYMNNNTAIGGLL